MGLIYYCTYSCLSALPACLFTYFLPACLFTVFTTLLPVLTCCSFLGCGIAPLSYCLPTYTVFQLYALALSFVLSHITCGGRSGGVARAWWEDGSLRSRTSSLLSGCSYPHLWDSQSILFSRCLLRGALPVARLWPCLVISSIVQSSYFSSRLV